MDSPLQTLQHISANISDWSRLVPNQIAITAVVIVGLAVVLKLVFPLRKVDEIDWLESDCPWPLAAPREGGSEGGGGKDVAVHQLCSHETGPSA